MGSSSTTSSSSIQYQSSQFCIALPYDSWKNFTPGAAATIKVSAVKAGDVVYFQSVDFGFNGDVSNIAFELSYEGGANTAALPLSTVNMSGDTITLYFANTSSKSATPLVINLYLWANPELVELELDLAGLVSPIKYGWQHNEYGETINSNHPFIWNT